MRVKVFECGENPDGTFYSKGVVKAAVEEFMKKNYRPVYLEGKVDKINDLARLAGVVDTMELDGNSLYAEITFLTTPDGQIMKTLVNEAADSVEFYLYGETKTWNDSIANSLEINHVELGQKADRK